MAIRPYFVAATETFRVRCVTAAESQAIDEKLFGLGYVSEQLMVWRNRLTLILIPGISWS